MKSYLPYDNAGKIRMNTRLLVTQLFKKQNTLVWFIETFINEKPTGSVRNLSFRFVYYLQSFYSLEIVTQAGESTEFRLSVVINWNIEFGSIILGRLTNSQTFVIFIKDKCSQRQWRHSLHTQIIISKLYDAKGARQCLHYQQAITNMYRVT